MTDKQRTPPQNRSLHLYCKMVSDEMNAAGYDFKQVIKMPVSFTMEKVKEDMFKPIMRAMYPDKTSTTELSTIELQKVYEVMNNATSEKFGVGVPFPSKDDI